MCPERQLSCSAGPHTLPRLPVALPAASVAPWGFSLAAQALVPARGTLLYSTGVLAHLLASLDSLPGGRQTDSCLTRHLEPITHPTGVTRAEHREPPLTPQSSGSSPSIPSHRPSHPKHFNQPGAAQSEPYGILATSSLPSSRTTSPSGDQECRLTERVAFSSQGAGDQDPGGPCPQYTHCYCAALAYLPSNPGVHALTGVPRASQEGRSSPCLNLDRQDGALAEWGV